MNDTGGVIDYWTSSCYSLQTRRRATFQRAAILPAAPRRPFLKMVERRRNSLILASTKTLLDSVLSSSKPDEPGQQPSSRSPNFLRFESGILRFSKDETLGAELNEASFLVGASYSVLKKLRILSGSLVCFNSLVNLFQLRPPVIIIHLKNKNLNFITEL